MENHSGKFISRSVSTFEDKTDIDGVNDIASMIPPLPYRRPDNAIVLFIEEYFGRFWWLWLVVLIILKTKKI